MSQSNYISTEEFLRRASLQESTDGFRALLDEETYLDVPERLTEFELVHGHIIENGTKMGEDWNMTAFELDGVVAGYNNGRKALGHSVSAVKAKIFAHMDEKGIVHPPKGVHHDDMTDTLLELFRAVRAKGDALTPKL